jgi:simple sugar transport system substrate-binding protein
MNKTTVRTIFIMFCVLSLSIPFAVASEKPPQSGKGITIWFDTGGPVGGPYNTIVQNGAMQAAVDMGCDVKYLYSDWNPEKVVENFKQAVAASPDGIVLMGLPGDDALEPFIKEAFDKGILVTCVDTNLPETLSEL